MLKRILIFVFAIAIVNASITSGTVFYDKSGSAQKSSTAPSSVPTAPPKKPVVSSSAVASTPNPYVPLVEKLAAKYGVKDSQYDNALTITQELHNSLSAALEPANFNFAAFLLASAYADTGLIPTEEKLSAKTDVAAAQKKYFDQGYYGRGFVHFTGLFNYERFTRQLNIDLSHTPEQLLNPTVAAKVLVFGALNGKFTGEKLSNFLGAKTASQVQFKDARRSINGDNNAVAIGKMAFELVSSLASN